MQGGQLRLLNLGALPIQVLQNGASQITIRHRHIPVAPTGCGLISVQKIDMLLESRLLTAAALHTRPELLQKRHRKHATVHPCIAA